MKFSLIQDFTINYPENKITNIFVKSFIFYYIKNKHKLNFITNLNVYENDLNKCKFSLQVQYIGKKELIEIELSDNHIHYTTETFEKNLKQFNYTTHQDFFDKLSDHINEENKKYNQNEINIKMTEHLRQEQTNIDEEKIDKPILQKLKDEALDFIRENMTEHIGQGHLLINLLITEYNYYLKNKDLFKFTLEINNIFHWLFKYNEYEFEFILVPSVHPLIPPIIDIKKMNNDNMLMIKLIEQPYIVKWNSYHSVLRLGINFISIIENYKKLNTEKPIIKISDETNYMINIFVKTKTYQSIDSYPNLYNNIYIEDKESGIENKNTIIVKMTYDEDPTSNKYKLQYDNCRMINLMYYNRLLDLNIQQIDKFILNIIYNIPNINIKLKEKIKNYI